MAGMGAFRTAFQAVERENGNKRSGADKSKGGEQASVIADLVQPGLPRWLHVLVDEGAGLGNSETYLIVTLRPKSASTEHGGSPVERQTHRTAARYPVDGHALFMVLMLFA